MPSDWRLLQALVSMSVSVPSRVSSRDTSSLASVVTKGLEGEGWGLEFFITVALRCRRALNMLSAGERVHGGEG